MIHECFQNGVNQLCVFIFGRTGGGFSANFCTHREESVIHEMNEKKIANQSFLPKAMNNKILKSSDENINMNFLYVGFCSGCYRSENSLFALLSAACALAKKIYGPILWYKTYKAFPSLRLEFHSMFFSNFRHMRNWRKRVYFRLIEMKFIPY